jgi:hypothetical protein
MGPEGLTEKLSKFRDNIVDGDIYLTCGACCKVKYLHLRNYPTKEKRNDICACHGGLELRRGRSVLYLLDSEKMQKY